MTIPPAFLIYGGFAISAICLLVLAIRYVPKLPAAWDAVTGWFGSRTVTQPDPVATDPQICTVMCLRKLVGHLREAGASPEQVRAIEDAAWPVIREMGVRS